MKRRTRQGQHRAEDAIHAFVGRQHRRLTQKQEIVVALAFSHVARYEALLRWIKVRYERLGAHLMRHSAWNAAGRRPSRVTSSISASAAGTSGTRDIPLLYRHAAHRRRAARDRGLTRWPTRRGDRLRDQGRVR